MKKVLILVSSFAAIYFLAQFGWQQYHTPVAFVKRLTGLDIPSNATTVSYMDDYSLLLTSGITCGELAVSQQDLPDLLQQAREAHFQSNLESGQDNLLAGIQQASCCRDTSVRFGQTPGMYKTLREDAKESSYVVIDSLHRKIHFFQSIPNAIW